LGATSLALLFGDASAHAQAIFQPFSANRIRTTGKKTTTGKAYATEKASLVAADLVGGAAFVSLSAKRLCRGARVRRDRIR